MTSCRADSNARSMLDVTRERCKSTTWKRIMCRGLKRLTFIYLNTWQQYASCVWCITLEIILNLECPRNVLHFWSLAPPPRDYTIFWTLVKFWTTLVSEQQLKAWCSKKMFAGGRDSSVPVPRCPRHFGTSLMVPKCLGSEVSWVWSVLTPYLLRHFLAHQCTQK